VGCLHVVEFQDDTEVRTCSRLHFLDFDCSVEVIDRLLCCYMSNTVHSVPPTPAEKGQDGGVQAKPPWTTEALIALAEETSNHGAHIPEYGAVEKQWKDVLEAMRNRGFNFANFRTLQHRFNRLKDDFKKESHAKANTSGVEDNEENLFDLLLEDMTTEIQDHQAENAQKKNEKKNRGSSTCSWRQTTT
jgi:hypothetical protein